MTAGSSHNRMQVQTAHADCSSLLARPLQLRKPKIVAHTRWHHYWLCFVVHLPSLAGDSSPRHDLFIKQLGILAPSRNILWLSRFVATRPPHHSEKHHPSSRRCSQSPSKKWRQQFVQSVISGGRSPNLPALRSQKLYPR